jgi:hypothetical protein
LYQLEPQRDAATVMELSIIIYWISLGLLLASIIVIINLRLFMCDDGDDAAASAGEKSITFNYSTLKRQRSVCH